MDEQLQEDLAKHLKELKAFSKLVRSWADTIDQKVKELDEALYDAETREMKASDPQAERLNSDDDGSGMSRYHGT